MKKSLLIIFAFIFVASYSNAQLSISPDVVTASVVDGDTDVAAYSQVKNESGAKKNYTWVRSIVSITEGWTSAVCDKNLCYLTSTETQNFEMVDGEEGDIIVHVYPPNQGANASEGSAVVEVTVTDDSDPDVSVLGVFYFNSDPSGTTTVEEQRVRVYPNPTNGLFFLKDNGIAKRVAVYDLAGRQVRLFDASKEEQFDIRDLPKGTYFIQLLSRDDSLITTKILNKV